MLILERILSRFPTNDFGDSGLDHRRSGQATVSSAFSGSPYSFKFAVNKPVPGFSHSEEWDEYEEDIPQY